MAATASQDDDIIVGINVTPLVDIVLVLLIIFMVTASYIVSPAIEVELPRAVTAQETVQSTLSLVLDRDGQLWLNGVKADDAALDRTLRAERSRHPELQAIIAADKAVSHGAVVGLIDRVKLAGVTRFALNTHLEETPGHAAVQ